MQPPPFQGQMKKYTAIGLLGLYMVKEASDAFVATTNILTIETTAVTKPVSHLESQQYTQPCILNDSLSMLRKSEVDSIRQNGLNSCS